MRLRILRARSLERFKIGLHDRSRLENYVSGSPPSIDDEDLIDSIIEVRGPLPKLVLPEEPRNISKMDAINAEILHRDAFPGLQRVQAADERLWVALTHVYYWDYTWRRYPNASKGPEYVKEHWFVSARGLAGLRRNAISRLWWAAELTVAPWEADPALELLASSDRYFYTKVLLKSQQIFQDVMERDFGSHTRLRICFLKALHESFESGPSPDELVKAGAKRMVLMLEHRKLGIYDSVQDLLGECRRTMEATVESLRRRAATAA